MTDNPADEREISLLDILDFCVRHGKILIGTTLAAGIISAAVALSLPNIYTTMARMVPPPADIFPAAQVKAVIESGALADGLVQRFSLAQAFGVETGLEARDLLMGATRIRDKDGIITVEVDDRDPVRAAMLSNAYPEEFDRRMRLLGLSATARKRVMAESRIDMLEAELARARAALQEVSRTSSSDAYLMEKQRFIDNLSLLRVELDLVGEDPAALPVRNDIETIHERLERLKEAGAAGFGGRTAAEREYLRRYGEAKYTEALAERLRKRLVMLRAEESAYGVRIVDPAITPTEKSKPRRTLIVLAATLATAFLTIVLLLLTEAVSGLHRQRN